MNTPYYEVLPVQAKACRTEKGERPSIRLLGRVDYAVAREAMQDFTEGRGNDTADEIWLLEHPPVYTLGQAGRREHVHDTGLIPVVCTERGGQVTYHGPGQVVAYLMIDLRRRAIKVREFVGLIEASVIQTLAAYNVVGVRRPGAPGIYVLVGDELQKIAALGLKVRNGCTYHGVALNVAMDLAPFDAIDPCGYKGLRTIDLATLGVLASPYDVGERLAMELSAHIAGKDIA